MRRRTNLLSGLAEPLKIAGWLIRGQEGLDLLRGATYHDRRLMRELAKAHQMESQLGELALDKASSSDVRDLARLLIQDHVEAMDELQLLADLENVPLPEPMEQGPVWQRLETHVGQVFEHAYVDEAAQRQDKAIQLVLRISSDACLPALRNLARRLVPVLENHHDLAKALLQARLREAG